MQNNLCSSNTVVERFIHNFNLAGLNPSTGIEAGKILRENSLEILQAKAIC
jgi:hypothetical protein